MSELENGQDRFNAERIITASPASRVQPKPKRHNAKLCSLVIQERIVNALAAGDSKSGIAKALGISRNTVSARNNCPRLNWLCRTVRPVRILGAETHLVAEKEICQKAEARFWTNSDNRTA
jgi:hypothetical protein